MRIKMNTQLSDKKLDSLQSKTSFNTTQELVTAIDSAIARYDEEFKTQSIEGGDIKAFFEKIKETNDILIGIRDVLNQFSSPEEAKQYLEDFKKLADLAEQPALGVVKVGQHVGLSVLDRKVNPDFPSADPKTLSEDRQIFANFAKVAKTRPELFAHILRIDLKFREKFIMSAKSHEFPKPHHMAIYPGAPFFLGHGPKSQFISDSKKRDIRKNPQEFRNFLKYNNFRYVIAFDPGHLDKPSQYFDLVRFETYNMLMVKNEYKNELSFDPYFIDARIVFKEQNFTCFKIEEQDSDPIFILHVKAAKTEPVDFPPQARDFIYQAIEAARQDPDNHRMYIHDGFNGEDASGMMAMTIMSYMAVIDADFRRYVKNYPFNGSPIDQRIFLCRSLWNTISSPEQLEAAFLFRNQLLQLNRATLHRRLAIPETTLVPPSVGADAIALSSSGSNDDKQVVPKPKSNTPKSTTATQPTSGFSPLLDLMGTIGKGAVSEFEQALKNAMTSPKVLEWMPLVLLKVVENDRDDIIKLLDMHGLLNAKLENTLWEKLGNSQKKPLSKELLWQEMNIICAISCIPASTSTVENEPVANKITEWAESIRRRAKTKKDLVIELASEGGDQRQANSSQIILIANDMAAAMQSNRTTLRDEITNIIRRCTSQSVPTQVEFLQSLAITLFGHDSPIVDNFRTPEMKSALAQMPKPFSSSDEKSLNSIHVAQINKTYQKASEFTHAQSMHLDKINNTRAKIADQNLLSDYVLLCVALNNFAGLLRERAITLKEKNADELNKQALNYLSEAINTLEEIINMGKALNIDEHQDVHCKHLLLECLRTFGIIASNSGRPLQGFQAFHKALKIVVVESASQIDEFVRFSITSATKCAKYFSQLAEQYIFTDDYDENLLCLFRMVSYIKFADTLSTRFAIRDSKHTESLRQLAINYNSISRAFLARPKSTQEDACEDILNARDYMAGAIDIIEHRLDKTDPFRQKFLTEYQLILKAISSLNFQFLGTSIFYTHASELTLVPAVRSKELIEEMKQPPRKPIQKNVLEIPEIEMPTEGKTSKEPLTKNQKRKANKKKHKAAMKAIEYQPSTSDLLAECKTDEDFENAIKLFGQTEARVAMICLLFTDDEDKEYITGIRREINTANRKMNEIVSVKPLIPAEAKATEGETVGESKKEGSEKTSDSSFEEFSKEFTKTMDELKINPNETIKAKLLSKLTLHKTQRTADYNKLLAIHLDLKVIIERLNSRMSKTVEKAEAQMAAIVKKCEELLTVRHTRITAFANEVANTFNVLRVRFKRYREEAFFEDMIKTVNDLIKGFVVIYDDFQKIKKSYIAWKEDSVENKIKQLKTILSLLTPISDKTTLLTKLITEEAIVTQYSVVLKALEAREEAIKKNIPMLTTTISTNSKSESKSIKVAPQKIQAPQSEFRVGGDELKLDEAPDKDQKERGLSSSREQPYGGMLYPSSDLQVRLFKTFFDSPFAQQSDAAVLGVAVTILLDEKNLNEENTLQALMKEITNDTFLHLPIKSAPHLVSFLFSLFSLVDPESDNEVLVRALKKLLHITAYAIKQYHFDAVDITEILQSLDFSRNLIDVDGSQLILFIDLLKILVQHPEADVATIAAALNGLGSILVHTKKQFDLRALLSVIIPLLSRLMESDANANTWAHGIYVLAGLAIGGKDIDLSPVGELIGLLLQLLVQHKISDNNICPIAYAISVTDLPPSIINSEFLNRIHEVAATSTEIVSMHQIHGFYGYLKANGVLSDDLENKYQKLGEQLAKQKPASSMNHQTYQRLLEHFLKGSDFIVVGEYPEAGCYIDIGIFDKNMKKVAAIEINGVTHYNQKGELLPKDIRRMKRMKQLGWSDVVNYKLEQPFDSVLRKQDHIRTVVLPMLAAACKDFKDIQHTRQSFYLSSGSDAHTLFSSDLPLKDNGLPMNEGTSECVPQLGGESV